MFNRIKWFIQRGVRGYADCDIWDFNEYLAGLIIAGCRKLKEDYIGCPGGLFDKTKKNNECWKWAEILEEIAQGFEAVVEIDTGCKKSTKSGKFYKLVLDKKNNKRLRKKYDRGMKLFSEYFLTLWN